MSALLGEVEKGMPVFDLHNEPVGTVSRVAPEQADAGCIMIEEGSFSLECAARADQLGAVDREEGVLLNTPRNDLRRGEGSWPATPSGAAS